MAEIKFWVSTEPSPPSITFELSATKEKLSVKVTEYKMKLRITPDKGAVSNGQLAPSFLGDFLTARVEVVDAKSGGALINEICTMAEKAIDDMIKSKLTDAKLDIKIGEALTHSFKIEEVPVTLSPNNLSLEVFGGCIMACGELNLT